MLRVMTTLKPRFLEVILQKFGDLQIVAGLGPQRVDGARIFPAVPGVDDYGVKTFRCLDFERAEDWINDLLEVHD